MRSAADIVKAYWVAADHRNWSAFANLLADDVVYFPGDWRLRVIRIVGDDRYAASWIDFTNADGTNQPGLCFFELNDEGKIARITDFWPDPYDLPPEAAPRGEVLTGIDSVVGDPGLEPG